MASAGKRVLERVLGGVGLVVAVGVLYFYVYRLDPCKELARIKIEEHWAKESGAPPWYPNPGEREKYEKRKAEMQQRCAAQQQAAVQ
jgi:hypothetical protein